MRINILQDDIYMPEPVGKQTKYWFKSYGNRYLFKKATIKKDGTPAYNDVSECMAADIAKLLDIPTAEYFLCTNDSEYGVVTKDFLNNEMQGPKQEEFFDGEYLISQIDPGFISRRFQNPKTHQYYTADLIIQSVEKYGLRKEVLNMLVFDSLIGNKDRNPSNYGIIINHKENTIRFAPLYDSCASLGASIIDFVMDRCFNGTGKIVDPSYLDSIIHKQIISKVTLDRFLLSKEKLEWDLEEEKRILGMIEQRRKELVPLIESGEVTVEEYHNELNNIGNQYCKYDFKTSQYQSMISYLTLNYAEEMEEIMEKISQITREKIDELFDYYKDDIPLDRLNMAKEIVLRRAAWMTKFYNEKKLESRGKSI